MSETADRKSYAAPESPRVIVALEAALADLSGAYSDLGSGYGSSPA